MKGANSIFCVLATMLALQLAGDELNERNASRLIWTPPITWNAHSFIIEYDKKYSRSDVIAPPTVLYWRLPKNISNTERPVIDDDGLFRLTPKQGFEIAAQSCFKADDDNGYIVRVVKQPQMDIIVPFGMPTDEDGIFVPRNARCRLAFTIDLQNNCNEDLMFPASSTVPVYAGETLVLEVRPENKGNSQMLTIPHGTEVTIDFRRDLNKEQALRILELMKGKNPAILPERGQLIIYSLSGKIRNAIQESLGVEYSIIRCGRYEWKIRSTWNGRRVTLREAMWAVNSCMKRARL